MTNEDMLKYVEELREFLRECTELAHEVNEDE